MFVSNSVVMFKSSAYLCTSILFLVEKVCFEKRARMLLHFTSSGVNLVGDTVRYETITELFGKVIFSLFLPPKDSLSLKNT